MSNSERGGGEAIVKSVPSMHVQLLCRLQNYENIGDVSKNNTHSGKLHNIVYLFISHLVPVDIFTPVFNYITQMHSNHACCTQ